MNAAVQAGLELFGENRVQEAAAKIPLVAQARWHLVGALQSNKARRAVELFASVESVDSVDLARRLDRHAGDLVDAGSSRPWVDRLPIFLQVNVDADPRKAGFQPEAIRGALRDVLSLPRLEVLGLMTVGRLVAAADQARPTFVRLRELSERLRADEPRLGAELSMGMSDDFEVAVEEGATVVRIGRAIFGDRPGR